MSSNFPWLSSYEQGVPATVDVPDSTIQQFLIESARKYPSKTAVRMVLRYLPLGLAVAIGWQAGEFEKRTGIRCKVTVDPEDLSLDPDLSTAIFRIFQEPLTNIARHAGAARVHASLKATAEEVLLPERDNGRGITQEQLAKPNSFGLLGMRERTHYWGGDVRISGKPGKGTLVKVDIPLRNPKDVGGE